MSHEASPSDGDTGADQLDAPDTPDTTDNPDTPDTYDDTVEVRRDAPLSTLVGVTGVVASVAYLVRALGTGSALDWAICALTGVIGLLHLAAVLDARAPLVVIDHQGIRIRRGRSWHGLAWPDIDRVEHHPRTSLLGDGSLGVVALGGRVLAVRLSLSTQLIGSDWHELGDALLDLSEGRTTVVEPGPDDVALPAGPEPDRELAAVRREEVVLAVSRDTADDETSVVLLPTLVASDPSSTSTIVIGASDDRVPTAPVDPVVGPQLVAARTRVGLSVDQLAERTRIRPHVIESI